MASGGWMEVTRCMYCIVQAWQSQAWWTMLRSADSPRCGDTVTKLLLRLVRCKLVKKPGCRYLKAAALAVSILDWSRSCSYCISAGAGISLWFSGDHGRGRDPGGDGRGKAGMCDGRLLSILDDKGRPPVS
ncbi:hypothetical protein ElyMa_006316100 [Elysia marginata]|uniref:Uncharacterized protein n=1 Tax=Elysia marginata TaxID=1093978 RepID=A0AAV4HK53_9GAST|nr:hypothetical protein ElyMa_006316100 [Elysia marginata]